MARRVAILGSTGSIGTNALEVIDQLRDQLCVDSLTAHRSWSRLVEQAWRFRPRFVTLTDLEALRRANPAQLPPETRLLDGPDRIEQMVTAPEVDIVLVAVVGAAGLKGTWAAVQQGKTLAIANKETLVLAGPLIVAEAQQRGATLLPVDSEHSAVFQALQAGKREQVVRIVLTASGGPFRTWATEEMEAVTVDQALQHPTWRMGPKITIDSATMMNKALEIIEARWLFGLGPDQIHVVIHPQSVVHSMVEFADGSVIAQLSPPDMKLPIQYALCYPERLPGPARRMDWTASHRLEFEPADTDRFPALKLGYRVANDGGTSGAVLNAANEVAVDRFAKGEIGFLDIVRLCEAVLDAHETRQPGSLEELLEADRWARQQAIRWRRGTRTVS